MLAVGYVTAICLLDGCCKNDNYLTLQLNCLKDIIKNVYFIYISTNLIITLFITILILYIIKNSNKNLNQ